MSIGQEDQRCMIECLYCEAEGQAAVLDGKVQDDNIHVKCMMDKNSPYVHKLSHHGFPQEMSHSMQNMDGYHALVLSYRRDSLCTTLWSAMCDCLWYWL